MYSKLLILFKVSASINLFNSSISCRKFSIFKLEPSKFFKMPAFKLDKKILGHSSRQVSQTVRPGVFENIYILSVAIGGRILITSQFLIINRSYGLRNLP